MDIKERAKEIFFQHIHLYGIDGKAGIGFRQTVVKQIEAEFGVDASQSASRYNTILKEYKKANGLDKAPAAGTTVVSGAAGVEADKKTNKKDKDEDADCWSIIELVDRGTGKLTVGRFRSELKLVDAEDVFDAKVQTFPDTNWVLIKGIGPLHGAVYELGDDEEELRRHKSSTGPKLDLEFKFMVNNRKVTIKAPTRNEAKVIFSERYPDGDDTVIEDDDGAEDII
jgi:hypothetical protein